MELLWQLILLDVIGPTLKTPKQIKIDLKQMFNLEIKDGKLLDLLEKMTKDDLIRKNNYHSNAYLEAHMFDLSGTGWSVLQSIKEEYKYHVKLSDFVSRD